MDIFVRHFCGYCLWSGKVSKRPVNDSMMGGVIRRGLLQFPSREHTYGGVQLFLDVGVGDIPSRCKHPGPITFLESGRLIQRHNYELA